MVYKINLEALRKYIDKNYMTHRLFAEEIGITQEYLSQQLGGKNKCGHKLVTGLLRLGLCDTDIFMPMGCDKSSKKRRKQQCQQLQV